MRNLLIAGLMSFFCAGNLAHATSIRYNVAPHVLTGGYELTGGYIETDGTLGLLSASNITGYEATMSGPVPYQFRSSIPDTGITLTGGVYADATSLWVAKDSGDGASLAIFATDQTSAECQDCHQDLVWLNSLANDRSALTYDHHDHSDDVPDSGFLSFQLAAPQDVLTVATVVPEPDAGWMLACFFLGPLFRRGRRKAN